jgi:choline dehydrogenase-like flavoprotein
VLDDWELHRQSDFNPDPNLRGLPVDYPVHNAESPIAPLMYNAVGGSTIHWSAHFPRFRPSDFRVRTLDGVADDWPITYAQLEPFYDLNDRMVGVAGSTGDPAYPPKTPRQTPPIPLGKLGHTMVKGFERLGWHWWPSDSAILTRPYDGRDACNNCGPCDLGCSRRAKASADVTYWPKALAQGARLTTRARVREITVRKDGLVDGVVYYDAAGQVHEQKARLVVLACNGIGTPRLLLNSRSSLFPDGLANSSGLVGRNLMFHPYAMVTGLFDEPHNRVVLDNTLTDRYGIPAPRVIYTMSQNSRKMMAHGVARATEVLQAAGAREVQVNPLLRPAGWHLMGTTRMGTHVGNSVVDAHGRCHDVKNLFIVDGSRFVTGASVTASCFVASQQAFLASVLNRIVPASDHFPGAGDLGVVGYLDTVAGRQADLTRLFTQGLVHIAMASQAQYAQDFTDLSDTQKDAVLRHVEATHPAFFEALVQHTYSGYYSHPAVLRLLGLEARPPQPRGYHLEPFDPGLLDNIKRRGPLYRPA